MSPSVHISIILNRHLPLCLKYSNVQILYATELGINSEGDCSIGNSPKQLSKENFGVHPPKGRPLVYLWMEIGLPSIAGVLKNWKTFKIPIMPKSAFFIIQLGINN